MNDSALPSLAPRPAYVPADYSYQRRFGSDTYDAFQGTASIDKRSDESGAPMGSASVYRDGNRDQAELRVEIGGRSSARITLNLTASGLRDLAARLLDAAHDLESAPAEVLMRASTSTESASS
jgi:hypothetical protein